MAISRRRGAILTVALAAGWSVAVLATTSPGRQLEILQMGRLRPMPNAQWRAELDFEIRNLEPGPLQVEDIKGPCSTSILEPVRVTLQPGERRRFTLAIPQSRFSGGHLSGRVLVFGTQMRLLGEMAYQEELGISTLMEPRQWVVSGESNPIVAKVVFLQGDVPGAPPEVGGLPGVICESTRRQGCQWELGLRATDLTALRRKCEGRWHELRIAWPELEIRLPVCISEESAPMHPRMVIVSLDEDDYPAPLDVFLSPGWRFKAAAGAASLISVSESGERLRLLRPPRSEDEDREVMVELEGPEGQVVKEAIELVPSLIGGM